MLFGLHVLFLYRPGLAQFIPGQSVITKQIRDVCMFALSYVILLHGTCDLQVDVIYHWTKVHSAIFVFIVYNFTKLSLRDL